MLAAEGTEEEWGSGMVIILFPIDHLFPRAAENLLEILLFSD